jgi:hypothetical protein
MIARATGTVADLEDSMLGAGEGLELMAIFFATMLGLAIMVLLGKWWEA